MIKNIDSFIKNGRRNLIYLLNDELRNHYSETEIGKLNSELKKIKDEYKPILLNSKSRSEFLIAFSGIRKYLISETKTPEQIIWNQLIEELMIELFYFFSQKFQLTPNEAFIYYIFEKTRIFYNHKIEENYFYKYITQNGKVGLNILSLYACDIVNRQIKKKEAVDIKLFIFYFKNHFKLSSLIIENIDQFIPITKRNLRKFTISKSKPLIAHYLKEFKNDDDLAPKIESYEHNKHFYYLFLREKLKDCLRESENQLREKLGYKRIGEGYVREQQLYNEVIKYINPEKIKRRYRPKWLQGLELDIYIELENKNIGIEHQGEQHLRPIKYFGGIKSYKKQILRDRRKLLICEANQVKLLYCYYNEPITLFVKEILLKYYKANNISC
ncbi:hypothetical protein [Leptospira kanakyensis]|uniref:hypothetical protein n=1 Tax=Leptospira kanakyensis TaxID=2484968 RepID=UPI00223D1168|nr:hypothetical protein [Leptospira kanakyensis]MCW7470573.1 hypothetical protein [Leptospira kanakyensis]